MIADFQACADRMIAEAQAAQLNHLSMAYAVFHLQDTDGNKLEPYRLALYEGDSKLSGPRDGIKLLTTFADAMTRNTVVGNINSLVRYREPSSFAGAVCTSVTLDLSRVEPLS